MDLPRSVSTHHPLMRANIAFGWGSQEERRPCKRLRSSSFPAERRWPTAVEYAVMLALILVACITIVTTSARASAARSAASTFDEQLS